MRHLLLILLAVVTVPIANAQRLYADAAASNEALEFLKAARAVAIAWTDGFFDGGSLEYIVESEKGVRHTFVLSVEKCRRSVQRSLSLYDGARIRLVPDTVYDQMASLLREKLQAGVNAGLQAKSPWFTPDAKALVRLLHGPGYKGDLDPLYEISLKRLQAKDPGFMNEFAEELKKTPPNQSPGAPSGQRLIATPSPSSGAPPRQPKP